jgi:DNA-binding NarL/FixJ family response regulator
VSLCQRLVPAGWQVLVVSGSRDVELEAAVIAAGAVGTVPKTSSFEELVAAIHTATWRRPR